MILFRDSRRIACALAAVLSATAPAAAQAPAAAPGVDVTPDIQGDTNTNVANVGKQSIGDVLPEPFRSWNGARPWLAERGLTFAFTYQGDALAAVSGGAKTGAAYYGRLQSTVEFDPERLTGWKGALFHASFYQLHTIGRGHFIGSIAPPSDLEALPTTRLGEVWVEQAFGDRLSVRVGQLGVDSDFFLSPFYGIGVGGTFGWPTIVASVLPNGGPAYPFVSPAVRVKVAPTESLTLLGAVFDGDPAGPGPGDPQLRNRYGLNFRLRDRPFVIGEAQQKYGSADGALYPGTLRIGAWRHFGRFDDLRTAANGLPLSDPASIGGPLQHRGDYGVYGVVDQQIYQSAAKKEDGIFAFARVSASPSNRSPIDFYVDGGLSFQGLVPNRPDDQFGFLAAYSRMSRAARAADFDLNVFNGTFAPLRNFEALVQATYALRVTNGVVIQPNIQYIFHPGGGVADPRDPLGVRAMPNALVLGVRTTIQY